MEYVLAVVALADSVRTYPPMLTSRSANFRLPVAISKGASFSDMLALKGESNIGDKINTQIIRPLIEANGRLARSDFPDFSDPNNLGE